MSQRPFQLSEAMMEAGRRGPGRVPARKSAHPADDTSESGVGFNLLASLALLCIVAAGAASQFQRIRDYWAVSPLLNSVIFAVMVVGIVYALFRLALLQSEFGVLESAREYCAGDRSATPPGLAEIRKLPRSMTRERLALYAEQLRRAAPLDPGSHAEKVAATLAMHSGVTRYLASLLIFLGLLGTYVGLLMALASVETVLGGVSVQGGQTSVEFLNQLKTGLSKPLHGMGTAFTASVFGLIGSVIVGFLHLQLSSAQSRFGARLELLDDALLRPMFAAASDLRPSLEPLVSGGTLDQTVARYLEASQRQMKDNLESLAAMVERAGSSQSGFREAMAAVRAEVEAVNNAVGRFGANQDLIRDAMGRMVDSSRAGEENQRLILAELKSISEGLARQTAALTSAQEAAGESNKDVIRALRQETGAWRKAVESQAENKRT